jgi:hypothetical protein
MVQEKNGQTISHEDGTNQEMPYIVLLLLFLLIVVNEKIVTVSGRRRLQY